MTDTSESDKCQKERERRRKKYKYALVAWRYPQSGHSVEYKSVLGMNLYRGSFEIVCDWEPERVLRGVLKLLKEDK